MFTVRKILRRNTTFRPFSVSDENELIGVLRTKPRHVLKTVRQLVWRSRKKELKFRNTITFIMLTLQERLRQSEMEPAIASDIIENVLQECIRLDQHDLAHLLFRALLRFQKFGCVISNACMRHLFHSYRKTKNKELLGSFANDLQGRPELCALYVVTLLYAGKTREAEEAQSLIKLDELRTEDYIALVKAFSDLGHEQPVEELRNLLILEEASCQLDKSAVLKVFISCYSSNKEKLWTLLDFIKANKIPVRSDACTLLLRSLLKTANTMTEINEIETQLSSLGFLFDLTASSILVSSYARVRNAEDVESEGLMINKVDTLAHSIEMRIKEGDPHLDISTSHLRAVIRGYGVAGKADSIVETWERLFVKGVSDDIRVLNEVLKWLALVGNVRLIFHMKSKMDEMHIEKNSYTYTWLIKGLGKFYPNHVKKIYDEIKSNNIQKDIQLFNCLILVLSDIQDFSRLEQLLDSLAECERLNIVRKNVWTYTALLKAFCDDVSKCEKIYQEAVEAITEQVTFVHNAFLFVLSKHKKDTEMQQVFQCISAPTTETYNIMLNFYGKQHMVDKVDTLIHDMSIKNVEFNDVTYSTLISLYGKWKDNTRLTALLEDMKVNPPRITASFYSVLASTCRRVGDNEGVDGAWEDLVSSRLFPGAHVYNHFLTLYGRQNDLPRMQVVLDNMMKNIPPNPVTTTTIIDMLGKAGKFKDMEDVLNEMKQNPDTQPNAVTYHQVMNAYAKVGDVVKMENTRAEMILKGYEENAVTFNILAEGYGRAKRFEQLSELNELRRKRSIPLDEIGLCVVLGAYGRAKMLEEVCNMVDEISPELCSKRVIWVILDAFCRCREGEKLLQWVEHLKSKNMTEDDEIALLTYYGRAGFLNKIQEFSDKYAKSERPLPAKALSPMAVSYAKSQNFEKTVEILHIMRDQSAIPDASVCITLSTYFMKAGLHEQAQQIIQWRRQYAANNSKTLVSTMT